MLIRVKFKGTGTPEDPYMAPFPSYRMVTEINAQGRAIIEVPMRSEPEDVDDPGTPLRPVINGKPVLIGFRPAQKLKYLAKLRKMHDRIKDQIDLDGIE